MEQVWSEVTENTENTVKKMYGLQCALQYRHSLDLASFKRCHLFSISPVVLAINFAAMGTIQTYKVRARTAAAGVSNGSPFFPRQSA